MGMMLIFAALLLCCSNSTRREPHPQTCGVAAGGQNHVQHTLVLGRVSGQISGVGLASGKIDLAELSKILMSWVITLPRAATIAALTMWLASSLGKSA